MREKTLFKNLPTKIIALLIGVCILLIVLVCFLFYSNFIDTTVSVVLLIVLFIFNSLFTNEITGRVMYKKYSKRLNNPQTFKISDIKDIHTSLVNNKAKQTNHKYGKSYLLIEGKKAYKVVVVENSDLYFGNTEKKEGNHNSKLDDCTGFYGFEIFLNVSDEIISKVQLFTFQTDKVYYTGFYSNEPTTLIQANYEEPKDIHKEGYDYLVKLIGGIRESN